MSAPGCTARRAPRAPDALPSPPSGTRGDGQGMGARVSKRDSRQRGAALCSRRNEHESVVPHAPAGGGCCAGRRRVAGGFAARDSNRSAAAPATPRPAGLIAKRAGIAPGPLLPNYSIVVGMWTPVSIRITIARPDATRALPCGDKGYRRVHPPSIAQHRPARHGSRIRGSRSVARPGGIRNATAFRLSHPLWGDRVPACGWHGG